MSMQLVHVHRRHQLDVVPCDAYTMQHLERL